MNLASKKLIVFDLDGTLAPSKSALTPEMSKTLTRLLAAKKVAVISGGDFKQFRKQLVGSLKCPPKLLENLFLFPTTATAFYRYNKGWKIVYALSLSKTQKQNVRRAFKDVFAKIHYFGPPKLYGKALEDRGSQMSYSFLGQDVVAKLGPRGVRMKEDWKAKNTPLKLQIAKLLQKQLPGLEVRAAGYTTIDITKRGIDKGYGVRQIEKHLHIPIKAMAFVGDALFPGGNDYAARKSGIDCVSVRDPEDTQRVIEKILGE